MAAYPSIETDHRPSDHRQNEANNHVLPSCMQRHRARNCALSFSCSIQIISFRKPTRKNLNSIAPWESSLDLPTLDVPQFAPEADRRLSRHPHGILQNYLSSFSLLRLIRPDKA